MPCCRPGPNSARRCANASPTGALCFAREYDAAHLASHPQQTVKRIAVFKTAAEGKPHEPPQYNQVFRAELKNGRKLEARQIAGRKTILTPARIIDYDMAKSFYLTRTADGAMLRDPKGSLSTLLSGKLGNDDRMFRLSPSPESACNF